jgi:hypothetical protein
MKLHENLPDRLLAPALLPRQIMNILDSAGFGCAPTEWQPPDLDDEGCSATAATVPAEMMKKRPGERYFGTRVLAHSALNSNQHGRPRTLLGVSPNVPPPPKFPLRVAARLYPAAAAIPISKPCPGPP